VSFFLFHDRTQVGRLLAEKILKLKVRSPVVLAIPRGGVPVAKEIAIALGAQLDLVITRKIGFQGQPEFAIGAVTQDGEVITDESIVREYGIDEEYLKQEALRQRKEIAERIRKYRPDRSFPDLTGKSVILVDDGVATGNTMLAAVESVRRKNPEEIIVAVGVAPRDTVDRLSKVADKVICLEIPEPFYAIGQFYEQFEQVNDEEVRSAFKELDLAAKKGKRNIQPEKNVS
jgi:putative phosphoribosyl transferase